MEPSNEVKTDGGATTGLQRHLPPENIYMNLSPDGRYIQYNFDGNIFEVTAKYKPLIRRVGRGACGIVCSAMNSETSEKVAIKKITHACGDQIFAKRTLREIKLLRHLEHENIVRIKDIVLPPQRYAFEDVYIAYELMDTDLEKLIKSDQELTQYHHQFYMYHLLCGLKYIHSANVLHRDLKPANILLNANCELKICDFGIARVASDAMTEYIGARWYRAPEILLDSSAYTSAIDVWSVGCIFLEMMTRTPLFPGRDRIDQLRLILEFIGSPTEDDIGSLNESGKQYLKMIPWFDRQSFSVKFPDVPFLAVQLLEKMLKFDPRKRISVEDALADPYFKTIRNINNEPVCTKLFDFDFEEHPLTLEQIKESIYHEALDFNPEPLASILEPATVENEQ
ncbi:Mitogen-activated protein kinase 10 [Hirschfeldia incana]|nr:Mitogen-activated protein kinase 10 [Hirschfeldia incana]